LFIVEKERDELLQQKNSLLQDLLMAERVASLGFLAAGMSHYIRNWLSAVKAFVQDAPEQLQREKVDPQKLANPEFWNDLQRMALEHIGKIETLLLQLWSASNPGQLALADEVDLAQSISDSIQTLSGRTQNAKITVETRIAPSLPRIRGNKASLTRLFELLLDDELVSLPQGSRIRIEGEAVPLDSGQTEIRLRWRDNGPCLPNETLRRLLNFFAPRTDDPAESGITLMLCYFIVLQHGGKMCVTSEPPSGTVFHVSFYVGGMEGGT
jgi:signal transduction histidine kinase